MALAWFRAYCEFATDPKVQSMSESDQRRLIMLFCLRCCDVLGTLRETDIAFAMRITVPELLETKQVFIERGFIDKDWSILNWDKRQYPSDSSTERTRKYRERMRTSRERHGDGLEEKRKEEKRKEEKPIARATRLPADFSPSETHRAIAEERHLSLEGELESFRDYFVAAPGQKGVKLDWDATFRNWLRNSRNGKENGNGRFNQGKQSPAKQRIDGARRVLAKIAVERGLIDLARFNGGADSSLSESGSGGNDSGILPGL